MSAKKLTKKELEKLTTALSELRGAESQFAHASKNLKRVEEAVDMAWTAIQGFEGDLTALQSSMIT